HPLEAAVERRVEHVRDAEARLWIERNAPVRLERPADAIIGYMPVRGELVGERPHVAGALDVVLASERVDAHAFASEIAGGHRQVRHAEDGGRALAVLGDSKAVVDP